MGKTVAIFVTFHPESSFLARIDELAKQTDHVVVIDNSATARIRNFLTEISDPLRQRTTVIFNPNNQGVAAALNRGIQFAIDHLDAEWALTMDQDSRVTPAMLSVLQAAYSALTDDIRKQTAMLAPAIVPVFGTTAPNNTAGVTHCVEVSTAITSGNLVKCAAWQAIGGFNEHLFIDYVDHDFCFRLRRSGWKLFQCDAAQLVHQIGSASLIRILGRTVSINQHPPLRSYYIMRNGLYFWNEFPESSAFTRSDKMNTLKLIVKALIFDTSKIERLSMFWRGYRDFRKGRFGNYALLHPEKPS